MFLARLKRRPCYGGLDLAAVHDLTSLVLAWPVRQFVYVYPWFWIPEEGLAERARKDNVPYVDWVARGLVETTPGEVTDWRFVTERIKQLARSLDIRQIGFDRYGARDTVADLAEAGIEVVDIAQGPLSFNAPMRRLNELVLSQRLIHTGHPVLRWNVDCCSITQDANENIKPVKVERQRTSKRIDGVVATIMALDCAMKNEVTEAGVL